MSMVRTWQGGKNEDEVDCLRPSGRWRVGTYHGCICPQMCIQGAALCHGDLFMSLHRPCRWTAIGILWSMKNSPPKCSRMRRYSQEVIYILLSALVGDVIHMRKSRSVAVEHNVLAPVCESLFFIIIARASSCNCADSQIRSAAS